jgi:hypothetical protein
MECFPMPRKGTHVEVAGYSAKGSWRHRREKLAAFVKTITPDFVIAYGKDACTRVGELFTIVASTCDRVRADWHEVAGVGSVGKTAAGTVVARVGFFGQGQYNRGHTGPLIAAMIKHRGASTPLPHPWPPQLSPKSPK